MKEITIVFHEPKGSAPFAVRAYESPDAARTYIRSMQFFGLRYTLDTIPLYAKREA